MPIVHECSAEGCATLTMGDLCVSCEVERREAGRDIRQALDARVAKKRSSLGLRERASRADDGERWGLSG